MNIGQQTIRGRYLFTHTQKKQQQKKHLCGNTVLAQSPANPPPSYKHNFLGFCCANHVKDKQKKVALLNLNLFSLDLIGFKNINIYFLRFFLSVR